MDIYPFEDFVNKPFEYKGKKKEDGLGMENALYCLLYIYLNGWNSQAVVNKITATGIWRGSVALIFVTYFFTLPTIILCLYLGKFLKHGALSLHKACPLLFGVGFISFIAAFPLGAMMVYFPLSENLFMIWLIGYKCQLPTCDVMRTQLNMNQSQPCIEEKSKYTCCTHHGVPQDLNKVEKCITPQFPFYVLNEYLGNKCNSSTSIVDINCDYWLLFFVLCLLVIVIDVKGFHNLLKFCEKFYVLNVFFICWWCLMHFEVTVTGAWYYYRDFDAHEELLKTIFGLVILEVDNLSIGLPFLLMVGRLLDESVDVDQLAIRLAMLKIKKQFWQANMYIGVISVVSKYYDVQYICLHDIRRPVLIALGIVPEFFNTIVSRIIKYPAMFSYFMAIFLKKASSMLLFGNLLSYHLYFWEKKKEPKEYNEEWSEIRRINMKGKMKLTLVKVLVYSFLNISQRLFNLNSPMIPVLKLTTSITLALQQMLFSIFVLTIYSVNRFKNDVEAVTRRKLWPDMLTHLKLQPIFSILFTMIRLFQFYVIHKLEHPNLIKRLTTSDTMIYYELLPPFYLIIVFTLSFLYILTQGLTKKHLRFLGVEEDWGPIEIKRWKNIKPFNPGRKLIFYDDFYISDHMCFAGHTSIVKFSQHQLHNVNLFSQKWPTVFGTRKYKHHKEEIDELITEAYTWGILVSFQQT